MINDLQNNNSLNEKNKEIELNRNNSANTTLLMVVGFIFIAIAGVIFATTTWKYIPILGKQIILAVVAIGLFYLSHKVKKLEKTKTILYYLGTVFLGFFSVTLIRGLEAVLLIRIINIDELNLLIANLFMLVPAVLRFSKRKSGLDLFMVILMINAVDLLLLLSIDAEFKTLILTWAVFVFLFTLADYYKDKWIEQDNLSLQRGFNICFSVFCGIYLFIIGCSIIFSRFEKETDFLVLLVLTVSSSISYKKNKTTTRRVISSILILWTTALGIEIIGSTLKDYELDFVKYVVNCIIMVLLLRKELFCISFIQGNCYTYYQLAECEIYKFSSPEKFIPYLLVLGISIICVTLRLVKEEKIEWVQNGIKMIVISVLQFIISAMICFVTKEESVDMIQYLHTSVVLLSIGVFFAKHNSTKRIWYTLAMFSCVFALINQSLFDIPSDFEVEWVCGCLAAGIAIFRWIWNYKAETASVISFILVCLLMCILVIYNIIIGELANVMILGITCTIMLLTGVIKNNRKYTILSSVVLILIVLYISRDLWLNIKWWVYLLIAGIVMILFAVKKESES